MDKERLEEIERNIVAIYEKPVKLVGYEITENDYDWLIEQAKRAQYNEIWAERVRKYKQKNKRYREAFKQIKLQILFDGAIEDHRKNIIEIIDEALEGDCIHCNGKGFNGLDYCPQCNQMEVNDDDD
ncbi:hypothetical protein [Lederbergia galactosidilytica]|uniref:Uncharacterized protein n=1 Tax=Lederbergia galactosidilytica TaxID=217031 RepID=A0A177ZRG9_9BACI|nr:hypothetical protein [Lederbergia galactosidilytica]OAK70079.1 hypothetical protein ABB05_12925 [Lederbergia galactosidilytica]